MLRLATRCSWQGGTRYLMEKFSLIQMIEIVLIVFSPMGWWYQVKEAKVAFEKVLV